MERAEQLTPARAASVTDSRLSKVRQSSHVLFVVVFHAIASRLHFKALSLFLGLAASRHYQCERTQSP